jgi:uncharacterized protein (DUF4415 family)
MASKPNRRITDTDNPEWTDEDFAKARKPSDVLSPAVLAQFGKKRGPQKAPTKVPVSVRLSPEVVKYFKAGGKGWQTRIDSALLKVVRKKPSKAAPARKRA